MVIGNRDPDAGIFEEILPYCDIGGFVNSLKMRRLSDLRLNRLKAALAYECAVRVLNDIVNCLLFIAYATSAGHYKTCIRRNKKKDINTVEKAYIHKNTKI